MIIVKSRVNISRLSPGTTNVKDMVENVEQGPPHSPELVSPNKTSFRLLTASQAQPTYFPIV
jgi:hypothetical protein